MPTRGLAAVLNQGLATLGEKLGKNKVFYFFKFNENYAGILLTVVTIRCTEIQPAIQQSIQLSSIKLYLYLIFFATCHGLQVFKPFCRI